jgi:hypothetical protein
METVVAMPIEHREHLICIDANVGPATVERLIALPGVSIVHREEMARKLPDGLVQLVPSGPRPRAAPGEDTDWWLHAPEAAIKYGTWRERADPDVWPSHRAICAWASARRTSPEKATNLARSLAREVRLGGIENSLPVTGEVLDRAARYNLVKAIYALSTRLSDAGEDHDVARRPGARESQSVKNWTDPIVASMRLLAVGINPDPWLGITYAAEHLWGADEDAVRARLPWLCWSVARGAELIDEVPLTAYRA